MTTLTYYTYTSGEVARKALNAVATFTDTSSYQNLQSIALMIAAVATLYMYSLTRDPKHIFKWAAVYILVPLTLINMKATMQVEDKTNPSYTASVSNVPYIIAIPSHFMGVLMVGLTEGVETAFASPDDKRFGRTGMMFGSRLFNLGQQATLQDATAKGVWNDFFQNCIKGDVEINRKYSWKDIYDSGDIFKLLDTKTMSPLRGVILPDGSYKTCANIYPEIKTTFTSEATNNINLLGSYLYGSDASTKLGFLKNSLSNTHSNYIGISKSANDVMIQNMAINAIRNNVYDMSDSAAQAMNYAYTSNKMQTTAMWMNIGLQAKEFVPMIHTIFFLLFSCFSFVVVLVALLPAMTLSVLGNYFKTFANLALHPFVFAILNSIMVWSLESRSVGYADDLGGFTLSNANALDEMHTRFAAITGYLMMSTPLIAGAMLKGGGAVFGSLNYGLAGLINSVNSRTSSAMATGDISHANTNIDTHSYNNQTGNQHNTAIFSKTHGSQIQQSDGGYITTFGNGGHAYSNQEAVSNVHYNAAATSSMTSAIRSEYQNTTQALKGYQAQVGEGNTRSGTMLQNWGYQQSDTSQYTNRDTISTASNLNDNVTQMQSSINSVVDSTSFNHSDSVGIFKSLSGQISVGAKTPPISILDASISGSTSIGRDVKEDWSKLTSEQKQDIWQASKTYNSSASKVLDISNSQDASDLNANAHTWLRNWANNYTNTENASTNVTATKQKQNALTDAVSRIEQQGVQGSENLIPLFQKYVESQIADQQSVYSIMTAQNGDMAEYRRELMDEYINSGQFTKDFVNMPSHSDLNNVHQTNIQDMSPQQWQDIILDQNRRTNLSTYNDVNVRSNETYESHNLFNFDNINRIRNEAAEQRETVTSRFNSNKPNPTQTGDTESAVNDQIESGLIGWKKTDWKADYGDYGVGKQR